MTVWVILKLGMVAEFVWSGGQIRGHNQTSRVATYELINYAIAKQFVTHVYLHKKCRKSVKDLDKVTWLIIS